MTMERQPSRRAVFGALAGVPALAILPAAALASAASPVHPDAALFAMRPAIEAADKEFNAALDALEVADDAYSDKEPDGPAQPEPDFLPEELQALDLFGTAAALRAIRGLPRRWRPTSRRLRPRAGSRTPQGRVRRHCRA